MLYNYENAILFGPGPAGPEKHKQNKKVHYPFFHEMVSDRSSRVENWTHRRHFSRRVFYFSKQSKKNQNVKLNQLISIHLIKSN